MAVFRKVPKAEMEANHARETREVRSARKLAKLRTQVEETIGAARDECQRNVTEHTRSRGEIQDLEQVVRWGDDVLARLNTAAAETIDAIAEAVSFMEWLDRAKADLREREVKPVWEAAEKQKRRQATLKVSAKKGSDARRAQAAPQARLEQAFREARQALPRATTPTVVDRVAKKVKLSYRQVARRLSPMITLDKIAQASKEIPVPTQKAKKANQLA